MVSVMFGESVIAFVKSIHWIVILSYVFLVIGLLLFIIFHNQVLSFIRNTVLRLRERSHHKKELKRLSQESWLHEQINDYFEVDTTKKLEDNQKNVSNLKSRDLHEIQRAIKTSKFEK